MASMSEDKREELTIVLDDNGQMFGVDIRCFEPSENFKLIKGKRCQLWIETLDETNHVWVPL